MTVEELCRAYNQVSRGHGLPAMACAALQIESLAGLSPDAAWAQFRILAPTEGWLQFQSKVVTFLEGHLTAPAEDWGSLLAAEAIDQNHRAMQLRTLSPGLLRLTIATPATTGEVLLTDEVRHLATDKALGPLCYRRYWCLDQELGAVPVFAAFQGFARSEEQ